MVRFIIDGGSQRPDECRKGLRKFLNKAGVKGRFRVHAGGGRGDAYKT